MFLISILTSKNEFDYLKDLYKTISNQNGLKSKLVRKSNFFGKCTNDRPKSSCQVTGPNVYTFDF